MDAHLTPRERFIIAIDAAMQTWATEPMRWGVDDCALALANIIKLVLGVDPARRFRGRYRSRRGAMQVLGPGGLARGWFRSAGALHWRRIAPAAAQPGDIGIVLTVHPNRPKQRIPVSVICRAPGWFVGRGERGFSGVSADKIVMAWSVV